MLSRERITQVLRHEKPDRLPIYGWLTNAEFSKKVIEGFGSIENFEDKYEFDIAHLYPDPFFPFRFDLVHKAREENGGVLEPEMVLDIPMIDPNDRAIYDRIKKQVHYYREQRGRFTYIQTPGMFEGNNTLFELENHLAYLMLFPEELHEVYNRLAEWDIAFANNCIDAGVDMIHISDDWGSQRRLMFRPELWRRLIAPYHQKIIDAVKKRGAFVSLHCDGNFDEILDEVANMGYDVIHPFQESAGMDLYKFKEKYRGKFTVMGGLDVQDTLGFGKTELLKSEIERVIEMFRDGGLIYCTTHLVQPHCTLDELVYAYDLIYNLVRV